MIFSSCPIVFLNDLGRKGQMKKLLMMGLCGLILTSTATARESWREWVSDLKREAVSEGVEPSVVERAFRNIGQPSRRVKSYSKSQPEHRLTFNKYRKTRASNYRILLGKRNFKKNDMLLREVGDSFGVDPCFIVSFWGMETSYGNFMGKFPVIKSLATLAYDSKRKKFFRSELLQALHIVNDGHVRLSDYKGEWAGASGQPQFLPSSFTRYAVDYNQDGRKDIWSTKADVFASIANYLVNKGWKTNEPWAVEVNLPRGFDMAQEGKRIRKSVREWQSLGVTMPKGGDLPRQDLDASIIKPYGGPALLAFNNFRVIMRYNNSTYYAGSIGYMADKICKRR